MAEIANRPPPDARALIEVDLMIGRLQDHVLGKAELTSTQVSAALGLLKKTMPDLPSSLAVTAKSELSHDDLIDELD